MSLPRCFSSGVLFGCFVSISKKGSFSGGGDGSGGGGFDGLSYKPQIIIFIDLNTRLA